MSEKYATFEGWWEALLQVSKDEDLLPSNKDDPEAYREAYDDGMSPLDALMEDLNAG